MHLEREMAESKVGSMGFRMAASTAARSVLPTAVSSEELMVARLVDSSAASLAFLWAALKER